MLNLIDKIKNTRKKLRYSIAFILLLLLWFLSGLFVNEEMVTDYNNNTNSTPLISVDEVSAQDRLVKLQLTGIIGTKNNINVVPEVSGRIESINVKKGDFIKKDHVILSIEVNDKQLKLEKAEATLEQRTLEYESTESLNKIGYSSEVALASSLAELKEAESYVKQAKIDLENCNVKSPFDGIIDTINAKKGMVVNSSSAIVRLIQCGWYIVNTSIPESSIGKLHIQEAEISLPAFDHALKGFVSGVSMKSDDNTRSYEVEIKIPELEGKCMNIVGMTADVNLHLYKTKSYHVPAYALSLSDDGLIGVKTLGEDSLVQFYNVEILEEDEEGYFWVKLPEIMGDKITLITQGHTYVKVGELVAIN